jgi:yeast amino acid transporter
MSNIDIHRWLTSIPSSRTLTALAEQGYAPKIFAYIDRSGRPLPSVLVNLAFGGLAYVQMAPDGSVIFGWLLAMSALAALLTWGSICVSHIRFRAAWKAQGHTVDEIPHQAIFGVWGAWIGLSLCILIFAAQLFTAIAPVGGGITDAEGFFNVMLTVPVVLVFWIVGYIWKRKGFLRLDQIDLDTGRRPIDWEYVHERRRLYASWPWWRKFIDLVW